MIELKNIRSLSDFQRNAKAHIRRLKRTGQPEVITVKGEAAVVVQDTNSYQQLLDAVDEAEAIKAISAGLASARRGEGRPAEEVFQELARKYGIRLKAK